MVVLSDFQNLAYSEMSKHLMCHCWTITPGHVSSKHNARKADRIRTQTEGSFERGYCSATPWQKSQHHGPKSAVWQLTEPGSPAARLHWLWDNRITSAQLHRVRPGLGCNSAIASAWSSACAQTSPEALIVLTIDRRRAKRAAAMSTMPSPPAANGCCAN